MSVTKEQADFFWVYAEDNASSDGCDSEIFADIAGDMVTEAQGEIDRLTEQLASQVSASTKANHLRVKELEGALKKIVVECELSDCHDYYQLNLSADDVNSICDLINN